MPQVNQVHDCRSGVHAHPANVLGYTIHQVAGIVRLIKIGIQLLIVIKNFIFLRKFNMPAHYDNRLAHEEHKKTADKRQYQEYDSRIQDLCFEGAVFFVKLVDKCLN